MELNKMINKKQTEHFLNCIEIYFKNNGMYYNKFIDRENIKNILEEVLKTKRKEVLK